MIVSGSTNRKLRVTYSLSRKLVAIFQELKCRIFKSINSPHLLDWLAFRKQKLLPLKSHIFDEAIVQEDENTSMKSLWQSMDTYQLSAHLSFATFCRIIWKFSSACSSSIDKHIKFMSNPIVFFQTFGTDDLVYFQVQQELSAKVLS